jgi:hypothetical protein
MALEDTLAKIYKLPQGSMGKIASTGGPYMQETGAAVPASALDYVPSMKDRIVDNLPLVPEPMERMMMSDQYKDFDSEKRNFMNKILRRETGAVINDSELDYLDQTYFPQMGDTPETIETKRQAREQAEMGLQQDETRRAIDQLSFEMQRAEDPEERDGFMRMIEKLQVQSMAPMGEMAQQLAQAGGGEDTMLAHLRPGEIVLPPEMMEDPEFESMVETKFNQLGINPAQAVAGVGIASLNESTGLEQFGFFKKIGKSLKKVVKKVAPIAAFIPGVGTALGGVLGGIGGSIGGALGMSGTTGLGGLISSGVKGIAGLGIPGVSSIAGGASAGNFGGIMDALTTKSGLLGGGMFGETGSSYFGGPEAGKGLANRFGMGSGTEAQVEAFEKAQRAKTFLETLPPEQLAAMDPADLEKIRAAAAGGSGTGIGSNIRSIFGGGSGGSGGIGSIFGGGGQGGGLGGLAGMAGAGALAAGLGKLAYDEAKDAKGVSLSPVVAMDATGRYNLEAEMARRMGQQAPNPVEFGLLPAKALCQNFRVVSQENHNL